MQGAWDRGGREGQHVDASAQLFELFLVLNPESLLLVDDYKPELGEPHVLLKQPVGADDDVDGAGSDPVDPSTLLDTAAKPAEHLHLHWIGGQPFEEDVVMLLRQDGGGYQYGDLLTVHHRLERRAERDLGLAVADVPRDQPVHRLWRLHVTLYVLDGQPLGGRPLKFEPPLQPLLPWRGSREGAAR